MSRASAANLRRGEGGEWIVGEDGQPIADWLAGLKVTAPHPFGSLRNTRQRRGRSARPRHRPPPAGDHGVDEGAILRRFGVPAS